MALPAITAIPERRREPATVRRGGARWKDDPVLAPEIEALFGEIGAVVYRLRDEAGLSQDALARRAGIHVNTLMAVERGGTDPQLSTMWRIFRALGCRLQIRPLHAPDLQQSRANPTSSVICG